MHKSNSGWSRDFFSTLLGGNQKTAENSRPLEQRRTSGGNGGGTAAHGPLRLSQPRGPQSQMPKPPGAGLPRPLGQPPAAHKPSRNRSYWRSTSEHFASQQGA